MIWRVLIAAPWIVFGLYWTLSALKTRRTVSRESLASRFGIVGLELLGYVMLFTGAIDAGVLGERVLPRTYALAIAGVAFTWAGLAIALWARSHLGQYWSARVTLKEG